MKLIKFSSDKKYLLLKQDKGVYEIPLDEVQTRKGVKMWLDYFKEFNWFTPAHKKNLLKILGHTPRTHKKALRACFF